MHLQHDHACLAGAIGAGALALLCGLALRADVAAGMNRWPGIGTTAHSCSASERVLQQGIEPDLSTTRIAYTRAGNGIWDIYVADPDGRNEGQLTHDGDTEYDPRWSPDGSEVAYHVPDLGGGPVSILRLSRVGGTPTPIVTDDGTAPDAGYPAWHPDGQCITFSGDHPSRDGRSDLKTWCPGSGSRAVLVTDDRDESRSDWHPDGTRIAFESHPIEARTSDRSYWDIYVVNADGSAYERLVAADYSSECQPRWSPDGSRLAFFSYASSGCLKDGTLRILDLASGVITDIGSNVVGPAAWSPDGRSIIVTAIKDSGPLPGPGFGPIPTSDPPAVQNKGLYRVDLDLRSLTRLEGLAGGAQSSRKYEWGFGPSWWGPPPTPTATPSPSATATRRSSPTPTATPTWPGTRCALPVALARHPLMPVSPTPQATPSPTLSGSPTPAASGEPLPTGTHGPPLHTPAASMTPAATAPSRR